MGSQWFLKWIKMKKNVRVMDTVSNAPKKTVCNFSYCYLTLSDLIIPNTISYMGVSKNRGTTIFGNIHMYIYTHVCIHIYLVLDQISNVLPAFCIFFLEPLSLRRPQWHREDEWNQACAERHFLVQESAKWSNGSSASKDLFGIPLIKFPNCKSAKKTW